MPTNMTPAQSEPQPMTDELVQSLRYFVRPGGLMNSENAELTVGDVRALLARLTRAESERDRLLKEWRMACIPDKPRDAIGEAFDTGAQIIVSTPYGYELNEDHNCDAMGCGQWHVLYRFAKPAARAILAKARP